MTDNTTVQKEKKANFTFKRKNDILPTKRDR